MEVSAGNLLWPDEAKDGGEQRVGVHANTLGRWLDRQLPTRSRNRGFIDTFANGRLACRYRADGCVWIQGDDDRQPAADTMTDPWSTDWRTRERETGDRIASMVRFAQMVHCATATAKTIIQRNR